MCIYHVRQHVGRDGVSWTCDIVHNNYKNVSSRSIQIRNRRIDSKYDPSTLQYKNPVIIE